MKIFAQKHYDVTGRVLPKDDFRLARDVKEYNIDMARVEPIIEQADRDLDKEIPALTLSLYRSYIENGSTVAYGSPYRQRMEMAMRLFIAELVTDSGRYTDKLADVIWAMLDESTWVLPEHTVHTPAKETQGSKVPGAVGDKYPHGLELGACYRASLIALIHHFTKDKLDAISPLISERIVYELKSRIIEPFLNYQFWWMGVKGNRVNNWCPWNVSNILLTVALVEEDMAKREKSVSLALEYLDNFIGCYHEDGGCDEGPTYWNAAAACLFDSLELLDDMTNGYINIFDEPLIKAMGEYEGRMHICDNYFVNFADSRSTAHLNPEMLKRYGKRCSSDVITTLGAAMRKMNTWLDTSISYRTFRALITPLCDDSDIKLSAALDTYFPDLKVMVLREAQAPDTGIFFAMKGGNNDEMHNHNDVGSFIVYKNGRPVLIDAGVGTYTKQTFSKDRYKIWSMQSLYHNLPSFDGVGQLNGPQYRSRDEVYDKESRSLSLELREAYAPECGINSYVRTGSLQGSTVTISERIDLQESKLIDFVFMTHRKPHMSDSKVALAEGCYLSYDPALKVEIEEFEPVGLNAENAWGTSVLYRIHFRVNTNKCNLKFTIN